MENIRKRPWLAQTWISVNLKSIWHCATSVGIHLHEDKDHVEDGVDAEQTGPSTAIFRDLKERQKLQPGVDQRADAKRDRPDPEEQRSVALLVLWRHQLDPHLVVRLLAVVLDGVPASRYAKKNR